MTSDSGPLTAFFAACASAAGAGLLLGGLLVGLGSFVTAWDRDEADYRVRRGGFLGGGIGLIALSVERLVDYLL